MAIPSVVDIFLPQELCQRRWGCHKQLGSLSQGYLWHPHCGYCIGRLASLRCRKGTISIYQHHETNLLAKQYAKHFNEKPSHRSSVNVTDDLNEITDGYLK